jgi:hypothetical protein
MLEYVSLVCGNLFYDTTVKGGSPGAAEGATVPEKTKASPSQHPNTPDAPPVNVPTPATHDATEPTPPPHHAVAR